VSVSAHIYPTVTLNGMKKVINLATDPLKVLLVTSGTYTWNGTAEAETYVSDFLGGSGGGALTEVSTSGTGYTRQALTSVTLTDSGLITTLSCANPSWPSATLSASYALFYDSSGGSDSANQVICYWDFGSSQSVTSATFALTINASGLCAWASS
jgi:hypothetical protein